GVGLDRDRLGEGDLLPALRGLARERGAGQQRAVARPEVGDVGAEVGGRLVEADTADGAGPVGPELEAELDGRDVGDVDRGRRRAWGSTWRSRPRRWRSGSRSEAPASESRSGSLASGSRSGAPGSAWPSGARASASRSEARWWASRSPARASAWPSRGRRSGS